MKNYLYKLINKYRSDVWLISKFAIVGILNTLVDFSLFTFLHFISEINYLLSQAIAYGCATLHSYLWNRYWTFEAKNRPQVTEFAKFVVVNLLSLGVSLIALYIFREMIGISTMLSKIFATLFSMSVNFLLNRFWVFYNRFNRDTN